MMPRILKGCQKRESGTLFRVAKTIFGNVPVVALRLPPANFSNRFAVKHTDHYDIRNTINLAIDSTRAHGLSLNRFFDLSSKGRLVVDGKALIVRRFDFDTMIGNHSAVGTTTAGSQCDR